MAKLILKKEKCKYNKGFTIIELVIATFILTLSCGAMFKCFGVAAVINTSIYEKDRANILAVNALEDIKKDTVKFLTNKDAKEVTEYYDSKHKKVSEENKLEENTMKGKELIQYYDSKWNKVEKKSATYEIKSKVSGHTNTVNFDGLEPKTSMKDGERYYPYFMTKYLGVLVKNCRYDGTCEDETPYLFYVIYYYDDKEFEKDWQRVEGIKTRKGFEMNKGFKDYLSSGSKTDDYSSNREKTDDYSYKSDEELYEFLDAVRIKKDRMYTEDGKTSTCNVFRVYEVGGTIPVSVDFDKKDSNKKAYNIDAYNMADKPMNLYMIHHEGNNSLLNITANGGYVNEVEVDTNKNIDKTLYKIDIEVNKIETKTNLIKKQTEKYIRYDNPIH